MQSTRQAVALTLRTSSKLSVAAAVAMVLAQAAVAANPEASESRTGQDDVRVAQRDTAKTVTFNIKPQPMNEALTELGKQSGLTIIVETKVSKGIKATALSGEYTPDEALKRLLEPAGLKAEYLEGRTVSVEPAGASESHASRAGHENASIQGAQASQTDTTPDGPSPDEQNTNGADGTAPGSSQKNKDDSCNASASSANERSAEVRCQEVVITGSHIRGEDPAGSHVISIDRDTIYKSGYGRLEDFLATLPQNFVGTSELASQQFVSNLDHGAEVQLRGLGPGTTLTLVDGQRAPSSGTQGAFVDISNIPTAAIERVEILPEGASALYGSDAIGGVVNVILRKDYQGAETSVRFGEASGGQAKETEFSQLLGTHWSSGHVLAGYQYTRRDDLISGSRPYTATSYNLAPFGGTDFRFVGGNPGEILNPKHQPAFGIPTGQDGTHLTASQLLPGVINYSEFPYSDVLPRQIMHSAFASVSQDLGDRAEIFLSARYSNRNVKTISYGFSLPLSVPSSNPFYVNPFGGSGPVTVEYDFTRDLGPTIDRGAEDTLMATGGVDLRLPMDWHLTLSSSYARDKTAFDLSNFVNTTAVAAALADSNPATALNVFGDGSHTNPMTLAGLRSVSSEHGVDTTESAAAIADGPLFELPSGLARLAIGTEYRREALQSTSNGIDAYGHASDGRRDFAGFAEMSVPLISATQGVPLVQKLELSLAGRYDHYSDVGSTTNPKFGMTWAVINTLKLRGTWGTSFRAPPFYLSNPNIRPSSVLSTVLADPLSPTGSSTVLRYAGTNPGLRPETAKTWTAGFDFQPMESLLMSATYFSINYDNRIQAPPDRDPLAVESHYTNTGVVLRNPTQAQTQAICSMPAVLVRTDCIGPFAAIINVGMRNLASTRIRGLDFETAYHRPSVIGTLGFKISGTYTINDDLAVTSASPNFNVVDTVGNPLALRVQGALSWNLRRWSAMAIVNHTGSYTDSSALVARNVSSWTTVNLSVGYEVPDSSGWLSNTRVFVTARNVFDKLPPFVNIIPGFDESNADLLRRTGSIQISKRW